jgi:hypothetical protein
MRLAPFEVMTIRTHALIAGSLIATGTAMAALARHRRHWRRVRSPESAGMMFVGAIDEVELSGPLGTGASPEGFDPEEVPSEHQEINDLRRKMPLG